ncbi:Peroxiredoxin [Quillaja saponaria]|uniref:Glutaredoxin-dependent peroxiredoxin n=1 Tax=Quillaja saponaria TaxID=32244 RepID=A0AAD7PWQ1_QUISA|nr:Peroxiredoxin [Quillaja saponaria]
MILYSICTTPQTVSVHSLAAGKKVIIFGVPVAFTPTCSLKHVPGFVEKAEELKAKGVDEILLCFQLEDLGFKSWDRIYEKVPINHQKFMFFKKRIPITGTPSVAINDPHVMNAWAKSYHENKHVKFLADGSAKCTHALGLELDLTERGLGIRYRRFALLIGDLKVKVANVESGGEFTLSSADDILKALQTVDAFLSTGLLFPHLVSFACPFVPLCIRTLLFKYVI